MRATHFRLGTHFDNSSITSYTVLGHAFEVEARSWQQYARLILFPQMVLWPAVTMVAGFLLGWPSYLIAARKLAAEADLRERSSGEADGPHR